MPLRYVCQARVKALAKSSKVEDYIVTLPSSPAMLLSTFPRIARVAFDAENLPMASPINSTLVDFLESKITMRGGFLKRPPLSLTQQPNQPQMNITGLCMPTAARANCDGGHDRCHTRAVTAVTTAAT